MAERQCPALLGRLRMATKPKFPLALAEVTSKSLIQMLADTCERIEKERVDMNQHEKEIRWAASI